jgi:hypothetical protein
MYTRKDISGKMPEIFGFLSLFSLTRVYISDISERDYFIPYPLRMTKKTKKPGTTQVEEIDLVALETEFAAIPAIGLLQEEKQKKEKISKKLKDLDSEEFDIEEDEVLFDEAMKKEYEPEVLEEEFEDDLIGIKPVKNEFADFEDFDDFDLEDENEYDEDEEPKERGLKKMPIDRDKDRRRVGKGLQKFIDVTVPAEFLEGLDDRMQLLLKK